MTVNIEVDYSTMLDEGNQGAIYLFSGAKTLDEMIKIHMDKLGEELANVLEGKPLVTYNLEGRLRQDAPVEVINEQQAQDAIEFFGEDDAQEESEDLLMPEVEVENSESTTTLNQLDSDLDKVSMDLGIPQKIKVNSRVMTALGGHVNTYRGFPVEEEGMDTPYIIVYKTYSGSEIKLFEPETK